MMKLLRSRKLMRRVLQVTLILVIPSFVVFYGWGGGGQNQGPDPNSTVFASIKSTSGFGRTELTTSDWVQAKNQLVSKVSSQVGQNYNANQIEGAIPAKRIAEEAVNIYALDKIAQERGFEVTQGEIEQIVAQTFPGMTFEQINTILARNGFTLRSWLQDLRKGQVLGKAQMYVESGAHAPLPVLWREFQAKETQVGLAYVEIPVFDRIQDMAVSDAELQKEYEARKEELKVGDQAIYDYILVSKSSLQSEIAISPDDALAYYEKNKDEKFSTPGSATLRHVLISVPPGATEEMVAEAKTRIDGVHRNAMAGIPLSDLANQYSEDPQNVKQISAESTGTIKLGGLLPAPVTRQQTALWGPDFINAVFSIEEDTISSPVLTNRGWDIFQVIARTQPSSRPFDEVKEQVDRSLREERLAEKLNETQAEFEKARRNQTTLEGVAKALKTDVKETSTVLKGTDNIAPLGYVRDYLTDIAELEPGGEPTDVIETSAGYAVLQMKEQIPSHIPTLDEVREKITQDIKSRKALDAAIAQAKEIADKVNAGDNLTSLGIELDLTHQATSAPFALSAANYPYMQMQDLATWALRTPVGKTFITEGFKFGEIPRSVIVCQIAEKIAPSREKFLEKLPELELQALYQNRQVLLNGYLVDARDQLQPQYNKDIVADQ